MPHVIVEHSANIKNLDVQELLTQINRTLFEVADISEANAIKARLMVNPDFVIGFGQNDQAYIHIKIHLLSGRSEALKQRISQAILNVVTQFKSLDATGLELQYCVEIIDIDKTSYRKQIHQF